MITAGDGAARKELMFTVSGMSCANCAIKVSTALLNYVRSPHDGTDDVITSGTDDVIISGTDDVITSVYVTGGS